MMCFWYEEMIQSRLQREKQWFYVKRISVLIPKRSSCVLMVFFAQTHLLVMPPPGGSPGISSAARNLITYTRSGSSSLDLIIWIISVKGGSQNNMVINQGANSSLKCFTVGVWSDKSPSTFISICCSSAASCCSDSCDTWGAPGKQMMMMLMLSKLPCRGRQKYQRRLQFKFKLKWTRHWWKVTKCIYILRFVTAVVTDNYELVCILRFSKPYNEAYTLHIWLCYALCLTVHV